MTTSECGDVVVVDFPPSGTSQRKRRPALVVLDIGDADVVLAPITTQTRTARRGRHARPENVLDTSGITK